MPNLDGTGPNGQWPRTGMGMGNTWFWVGCLGVVVVVDVDLKNVVEDLLIQKTVYLF